jgi:putative oxidoreductase
MSGLSIHWRPVTLELLRWVLAIVFIFAGVAKLQDASAFATSIARFQLAPIFLVHPLALGLPPLEMLCGLALLVGRWKRQASFAILVLGFLFLGALLSAAVRGIEVECHCFGAAATEPIWRPIVRDLFLLAVAVIVHLRLRRETFQCSAESVPFGAFTGAGSCLR